MDYVFLGTGAAEAIPCYYCRCSYAIMPGSMEARMSEALFLSH